MFYGREEAGSSVTFLNSQKFTILEFDFQDVKVCIRGVTEGAWGEKAKGMAKILNPKNLVFLYSFLASIGFSLAVTAAPNDLVAILGRGSCESWLESRDIQFNDLQHRKAWLISAAQRARRAGDEAQRLKYLRELLEADPNDPLTHSQVAMIYKEQGDLSSALFHFRERTRIEGPTARNLMNLLMIYRQLPGANNALEICKLALEKHPNDPKILGVTAQVFMALKLYDAALATLNRKLALDPHDRYAYGLKSQIREIRTKQNEAR